MKSYKIKSGIEKIHSNSAGGSNLEWSEKLLNIENILIKLINNNDWFNQYKENVIFKIVYTSGNIPPKTKRIKFRKNIINVSSIPQKSMSTLKTVIDKVEIFNAILVYEITLKELNSFNKNIEKIYNNKEFIKNNFDKSNNERKSLMDSLSIIDDFSCVNEFKNELNQFEKKYVKFLPISDDIYNFIKLETNLEIKMLNDFEYSSILNYSELSKIKKKIPWIIKEINQIENLSFQLPNFNTDIDQKSIILNEKIKEALFDFQIPFNDYNSIPIIGVIDGGCSLPKGLDSFIDNNILKEEGTISDYDHGSRVSSLVIGNDYMNNSEDKLGFFKVKHFELLSKKSENSEVSCSYFHLQKNIFKIIEKNSHIKVWNLSLGRLKEPWSLNVSTIGVMLDYLSNKYDVLFVVSAGNSGNIELKTSINFPSDSLNCISVGSVSIIGNNISKSNYSSLSQVLQFVKPEISSFGGINNENGENLVTFNGINFDANNKGTSFSAPKISRIAAYLIHNGFSTLEAKAKIIALSIEEKKKSRSSAFGYISNKERTFLDLRYSSELEGNKPRYIDINLFFVEKITIAITHFVNPAPDLGEEYSLSDIEISLIKYNKDWNMNSKTPESNGNKKVISSKKNPYSNSEFEKEIFKRNISGKYFTSKKHVYKIEEDKFDSEKEQYAIRFRRMDLYELKESNPLKFGCSIILEGQSLTEEKFEIYNESIIEIDVNVDIHN